MCVGWRSGTARSVRIIARATLGGRPTCDCWKANPPPPPQGSGMKCVEQLRILWNPHMDGVWDPHHARLKTADAKLSSQFLKHEKIESLSAHFEVASERPWLSGLCQPASEKPLVADKVCWLMLPTGAEPKRASAKNCGRKGAQGGTRNKSVGDVDPHKQKPPKSVNLLYFFFIFICVSWFYIIDIY